MIITSELPTVAELQSAIARAKDKPYNLTTTDILCHGVETVRHLLGKQYHSMSLDDLRRQIINLSRAGKEPGKRKRTETQKLQQGLSALLRAFPRSKNKSESYRFLHSSPEFREHVATLKRAVGYRCQICSRIMCGVDLEGHCVDYDNWRDKGMLLIVCRDECHPIVDALRRRGLKKEAGEDTLPLFASS